MQFFDDMNEKSGFGDGEAMPDGVGEYREVYLRVINAFARKHGSKVRLVAWDRPGVHNGCMVVDVTRKYFDALKSDAERYVTGPAEIPSAADVPKVRDAGLIKAIKDAYEANLDRFVNVHVTIATKELNKLCRRIG